MRYCLPPLFVLLTFRLTMALADEPATWDFEDAQVGKLPQGWVAAKTGDGPGSVWKVVEYEADGKRQQALAQTSSEGEDALFNICVLEKSRHANLELRVAIKAAGGKIDQGGGLVWRYEDPGNYYITRWNPLEDNFRVYRVVKGKRTQLQSAKVDLDPGQWHTIRAVQSDNRIRCYLGDKLLLDVTDDTFKDAGAIGLWTKADAVTWFDHFSVRSPAKDDQE